MDDKWYKSNCVLNVCLFVIYLIVMTAYVHFPKHMKPNNLQKMFSHDTLPIDLQLKSH